VGGTPPRVVPAAQTREGTLIIPAFVSKHKMALAFFISALVLGGVALRFWLFSPGMVHCETQVASTASGPGIYDAKILEEDCDGIVNSVTMSVVLSSRARGKDRTVFVYDRKGPDPALPNRQDVPPTVTWLSKDSIEISIDMVEEVEKRVDQADGVKIGYRIGAVEYK